MDTDWWKRIPKEGGNILFAPTPLLYPMGKNIIPTKLPTEKSRVKPEDKTAHKSLEEYIAESGIVPAPPSFFRDTSTDDGLPITGRSKNPLNQLLRSASTGKVNQGDIIMASHQEVDSTDGRMKIQSRVNAKLDPNIKMAMSLEDIISTEKKLSNGSKGVESKLSRKDRAAQDFQVKYPSNVDPREVSLDDIIRMSKNEQKQESMGREGNTRGSSKRKNEVPMDIDEEEDPPQKRVRSQSLGTMLTPYRTIAYLCEMGLVIEMKAGKLAEDNTDVDHLWRFEILCGEVTGIAEAKRKAVAREIACREFLSELKGLYPVSKIPKYRIDPGLYLDPKIMAHLEAAASERDINLTYELTVSETDGLKVACTMYLDSDVVTGENYKHEYAKLEAAYKAYELITGEAFPKTRYFIGKELMDNYEYIYIDSEMHANYTGEYAHIFNLQPPKMVEKKADDKQKSALGVSTGMSNNCERKF